jgi:uncharacterized protein
VAAYIFDSSAVVKRYVREMGTAWVLSAYVTGITGVEVVSALTRQTRSGAFTATDAATALTQFRHDLAQQYHIVAITPTLLAHAMALAETHALRAYDAPCSAPRRCYSTPSARPSACRR